MAEVIKKSIPWFLIVALIVSVAFSFNFGLRVRADSALTNTTVNNEVPVFTNGPAEEPACHNGSGLAGNAGNPVNVGSAVPFAAIATDDNGDDWKLLICRAEGTTGTDCTGGAGNRWCVSSSSVGSGEQNDCSYTITASETLESYAWWGYACDPTGCSAYSQGTGNPGTPFYVNHAPVFTSCVDTGGQNPGGTEVWTSVSTDPDSNAADDTLRIWTCDGAGSYWDSSNQ
jgi:hypothetical protein